MSAELTIDPGCVVVSVDDTNPLVVIDHEDCKVWLIDLDTKYAEVHATSSMGTELSVHVGPAESGRTLHLDVERKNWTTFTFVHPDDEDWSVLAHCARYTLEICAYRKPAFGVDL